MNELTPEQIQAQTQAHNNFIKNQIDNKHLIPSLKTQIYSMGEFRNLYGEEKLVMDGYDTEYRSNINLTNNNTLTWTEIATPDPEPQNPTTVDSLPTTGNYSVVKLTTDNNKYYKCSGGADLNNLKSTDKVKINISLNESMSERFPTPNIVIDGKEYTSGIAGTDIIFYMNRDHRVTIHWTDDIVEKFLIIANR